MGINLYSGILNTTLTCFRYLILFAQRGANLDIYEEILNNNYLPVNVEHIINCTLKRHDLTVLNFELVNGDEYSRGQRIEFALRTEVATDKFSSN